jgi:hypothetical protein
MMLRIKIGNIVCKNNSLANNITEDYEIWISALGELLMQNFIGYTLSTTMTIWSKYFFFPISNAKSSLKNTAISVLEGMILFTAYISYFYGSQAIEKIKSSVQCTAVYPNLDTEKIAETNKILQAIEMTRSIENGCLIDQNKAKILLNLLQNETDHPQINQEFFTLLSEKLEQTPNFDQSTQYAQKELNDSNNMENYTCPTAFVEIKLI